ncbi:hypothetical protein ACLKA6_018178 [Drosophila palustris]
MAARLSRRRCCRIGADLVPCAFHCPAAQSPSTLPSLHQIVRQRSAGWCRRLWSIWWCGGGRGATLLRKLQ